MARFANNSVKKSIPSVNQRINEVAYYAGLTADELVLLMRFPEDSIKVYELKDFAQASVKRRFLSDKTDSESDAFRHFMWSGLLRKNLNRDLAVQYLNAHESGASH